MSSAVAAAIDGAIILALFFGISRFRAPGRARRGNIAAVTALLCGVLVILLRSGVQYPVVVAAMLLAGSLGGWAIAVRVSMMHIPAMVAFQNGAGGAAACLISLIELWRGAYAGIDPVTRAAGVVGLLVGAGTFSGSVVAGGKLMGFLGSRQVMLRCHGIMMAALAATIAVLAVSSASLDPQAQVYLCVAMAALSMLAGVLLAVRIGGADMPVLISFLNATSGVAAAFCGIIVGNRLLIAAGAAVAASGSILTHAMCRAMNRGIVNVFWSRSSLPAEASCCGGRAAESVAAKPAGDPLQLAADACRGAHKVIIVPGYGMALGQAQFRVNELAKRLEAMGKEVRFAIHPVAGRMPGHMNVLLAEAEVPYDKLFEMDDINPSFPETDVAIVVGACDVVNPAAIDKPDTPISGMPILKVYEAKQVIVCNLDERPGYSCVPNVLYEMENAILLFGDAKETISSILKRLA